MMDCMDKARIGGWYRSRRTLLLGTVLIGAAISPVGCASADSMQRLERAPAGRVFASPAEAIARTKAVAVKPGQLEYLELLASDGVVQPEDRRTFFKVVSVPLQARPLARVQVTSRCDCVGFRKFIFVPLVFVFDEKGQAVPLSPAEYEAKDQDTWNPVRLVVTWTFPVRSSGTYRVLVAADNAFAGHSVTTAHPQDTYQYGIMEAFTSALIKFDVSAVAVGEFTFLLP